MNNEKRLMLAVALSIIIIIGYQSYMRQFAKPVLTTERSGAQDLMTEHVSSGIVESVGIGADIPDAHSGQMTTIENNELQIVLTDAGAAVKDIYLLDYADDTGDPSALLTVQQGQPLFLSTDFQELGPDTSWVLLDSTRNSALYRASNEQLQVTKEIVLHKDSNVMEFMLSVHNKTDQALATQYQLYNGFLDIERGDISSRYMGADVLLDNKVHRQRPSKKTLGQGVLLSGSPVWLATRGRYFSFIMKPLQAIQAAFVRSRSKQDIYTGIMSGPLVVKPMDTIQHRYAVYIGPNNAQAMAAFDETTGEMIHYGVFNIIGRFLLKGLHMFYGITNNYGLAIIFLAFAVSLVLLPLTRKSLHSMKEMQRIQPETELIRKQYSDDPQKMNKEIIELYKKHKINPVGGCLPMLLQMPIFFSLYQVLLRSVELKGAGFLWIKDLAAPDAAFALPRSLPFIGSHINILPILMAIGMAIQQRLSQGGNTKQSDQQRLMAGIMPVMFGLIFYNMPSGLVLYWFTNTLFMLIVQEFVLKSRLIGKNV
jgi:YidC/Oxa1 family membrane protein insertase